LECASRLSRDVAACARVIRRVGRGTASQPAHEVCWRHGSRRADRLASTSARPSGETASSTDPSRCARRPFRTRRRVWATDRDRSSINRIWGC